MHANCPTSLSANMAHQWPEHKTLWSDLIHNSDVHRTFARTFCVKPIYGPDAHRAALCKPGQGILHFAKVFAVGVRASICRSMSFVLLCSPPFSTSLSSFSSRLLPPAFDLWGLQSGGTCTQMHVPFQFREPRAPLPGLAVGTLLQE